MSLFSFSFADFLDVESFFQGCGSVGGAVRALKLSSSSSVKLPHSMCQYTLCMKSQLTFVIPDLS